MKSKKSEEEYERICDLVEEYKALCVTIRDQAVAAEMSTTVATKTNFGSGAAFLATFLGSQLQFPVWCAAQRPPEAWRRRQIIWGRLLSSDHFH